MAQGADIEREARAANMIIARQAETSDYVIDRRRWYHAHPEIAYHEVATT